MGNFFDKPPPPPPMVLVPPLFDFPPFAARDRMLVSSYKLLFGKLALKCLFEDYFQEARHFTTRIMLKPIDDPHVDLIATVKLQILRDEIVCLLSKIWVWSLWDFPLLLKKRESSEDFGQMGLRYGSKNLSCGVSLMPFAKKDEMPKSVWLVSRMGRVTAGVQYEPQDGDSKLTNLMNWSCAIGYAVGSGSPLSPSFNFGLELVRSSQFIASFYQHMVVQRRVKNPFEQEDVVGITNYIDFGFELQTRVDDAITSNNITDSTFQVGASWQANKNLLLKAKVGHSSFSMALALKSWWKPSFTCNISATRDRADGNMRYGFGIQSESLREASYQRADPNYVLLTPNKEHLAQGIFWKTGKQPMLQSDVDGGNFDALPRELRPLDKIL
ncbi:hypothetical protein K1719_008225 [Acacia pycnantha]|nr:hypothetical protein K1719_008225 [Acacia pycnantha]